MSKQTTEFIFSLPAFIQDFAPGTPADLALKRRWNINVSGWILQAMPGAPAYFYDPTVTPIPQGSLTAPVQWGAFPGRLDQYYSANPPNLPSNPHPLTQKQIYALADTGYYLDANNRRQSFPQIPQVVCPKADWTQGTKVFGPYGPRGWLDEYCEWSAARDANGKLTRIDFACENPEYWNTLWKVSPQAVCDIYQTVLNWDAPAQRQIAVTLADLQLFYNGVAVKDPETGGPVYNPLNKWNNGPVALRTGDASQFSGGVMHLTSTPNTLQTELGLAGAATVQYDPPDESGNTNAQSLICCGSYGQEYRHSDPHIGQSVNQVVGGTRQGSNPPTSAARVCLANPVGLYIQPPNNPALFSFGPGIDATKLPKNTNNQPAQASDIWQVVRGSTSVIDPVTDAPFPGAMILHAICQIPSGWLAVYPQMTLADILVNKEPIEYAGQVANQFNVGLYARPLTSTDMPPLQPCAGSGTTAGQPLQSMMFTDIWDAFYNTVETAPTGATMPLASNSTFIAPQLRANGVQHLTTLTCNSFTTGLSQLPTVQVLLPDDSGPDPKISVTVLGMAYVSYAIPGNSFPPTNPQSYTALSLQITVGSGIATGLRSVRVTDPQAGPSSLPAALYVAEV